VTAGLQQGLTQYSIEPGLGNWQVPQPRRMPCQDRRRRPGIAILQRMLRMDSE
jgi:hypothetical protein